MHMDMKTNTPTSSKMKAPCKKMRSMDCTAKQKMCVTSFDLPAALNK